MNTSDDQVSNIFPLSVSSKVNLNLSKFLNYNYIHDSTEEKTVPSIVNNIKELPYSFMKPYLLYYNTKNCIKSDPYYNIINTKCKYNNEIENLKSQYKMITIQKKYNIDRFEIYGKMQDLLRKDPDKYFNHDYNWYYNGGTLDIYNNDDYTLVFHSENATNLCITKLLKIHSVWQVENNLQLSENVNHNNYGNAIFEIRSSFQDNNFGNTIFEIRSALQENNLTLGIRSWKKILLYNLNEFDSSNIKSNVFFEYSSDIPLSNFSLNATKRIEITTLDAAHNIKIWNIVKNTNKTFNICKKDQPWGQIDYLNKNTLVYANNYSYNVFDTRIESFVIREENINIQEEYKNLYINKNVQNNIYLTSQKNLYCFDLRNRSVVNKWSHLLEGNVFLSDGYSDISKDLICLASCDEKVLIGQQTNQLILPKVLPTIRHSFEKMLTYKPIEMPHYLSQRLGYSITGMKFVSHDNELSLISINSLGDMFIHEIEKVANKQFKNEEIICNEKFSECGKKILENIENTEKLNFIDKVVINNLESVLYNTIKYNRKTLEMNKRKQDERMRKLRKIKKQLKSKIEYCQTNLTDVWKLEINIQDIEEIDTSAHVEKWLSSINNDSQSNPEFDLNTRMSENTLDNSNLSFNGIENI